MPPEVRELRSHWPSQRDRVPHLTDELEKDFRFGQRISKTERGYFMGGSIKGGTSSMWCPANRQQYTAYNSWCKLEGLVEGRDDEALERLLRLLEANGVELATKHAAQGRRLDPEPHHGFGPLYRLVATCLEALPGHHLSRPQLRRIQLGGWGPDGAKASAYESGSLLMYEFAIRGARRTFTGLLLHELGHAHESALGQASRSELEKCFQLLSEKDAFLGVEFLLESSTRKIQQKFAVNEFLAETYMIYTACGAVLRTFMGAQEPDVRSAWETVYGIFRDTFDGHEYE